MGRHYAGDFSEWAWVHGGCVGMDMWAYAMPGATAHDTDAHV